MPELERYEWENFWWDEANRSGRRMLFIGDSITAGYRPEVKEMVKDTWFVDMFASSRAVDNPQYLQEIVRILDLYQYDIIHINNGLHGFHLDAEEYESGYEAVLCKLKECAGKARIILALSTPITEKNDTGKLSQQNDVVLERNRRAALLAEKYAMETEDLYRVIVGNRDVRNPDGFHYVAEGYQILAREIVKTIEGEKK